MRLLHILFKLVFSTVSFHKPIMEARLFKLKKLMVFFPGIVDCLKNEQTSRHKIVNYYYSMDDVAT